MAGGGYIKFYRSIKKKPWYKNIKLRAAFIDLLIEINYEDKTVSLGKTTLVCKRGQVCKSQRTWAKEWKMDVRTVKKFLELLKEEGTIDFETVNEQTTLITMLNYDKLQDSPENDDGGNKPPKKPASDKTPVSPKKFTPPTIDEVKQYFSEKGYLESKAVDFFNHYAPKGWVDKNGTPVKNWKGKAQKVWFKDEYKKPPEDDIDCEGVPINRTLHPDYPREYPYTDGNIWRHENGMIPSTRQEIEEWSK